MLVTHPGVYLKGEIAVKKEVLFLLYHMEGITVPSPFSVYTMCPDMMMMLHTSSLTQQKVLNYSDSSFA